MTLDLRSYHHFHLNSWYSFTPWHRKLLWPRRSLLPCNFTVVIFRKRGESNQEEEGITKGLDRESYPAYFWHERINNPCQATPKTTPHSFLCHGQSLFANREQQNRLWKEECAENSPENPSCRLNESLRGFSCMQNYSFLCYQKSQGNCRWTLFYFYSLLSLGKSLSEPSMGFYVTTNPTA